MVLKTIDKCDMALTWSDVEVIGQSGRDFSLSDLEESIESQHRRQEKQSWHCLEADFEEIYIGSV